MTEAERWASQLAKSEGEAFEKSLLRIKEEKTMMIHGRHYSEPELQAHIEFMENKLLELEDKHLSECRQISEYDIEVRQLRAYIKELLKANQWISVKERLPENDECELLVWVKHGRVNGVEHIDSWSEATWDGDEQHFCDNDYELIRGVTHWRHVPLLESEALTIIGEGGEHLGDDGEELRQLRELLHRVRSYFGETVSWIDLFEETYMQITGGKS